MQAEERRIDIPWWVADCISDTKTDVFAISGGLGSAKTTGCAMFFLDRWLLNRDSQFSWAVAPTHTKIEQILLPAIRMILFDQYGMQEDIHYRIYKSRFFKLVCKGYPHEIHFLSGDRPGLFVGSNIACLWITEPGLMVREVFEKGQTRLRCPRALVRQTILEGTPEGVSGKGGWWAELGDIPGVGYDRRGTEGIQKGVRRFIVETTFNKHLKPSPEEYAQKKIRDVFAYDKNKILSYEKGLFVPFTKGSAYWEWVDSRNVKTGLEPTVHDTLYFAWDFNVSPLAWVALQKQILQANPLSPRYQRWAVFAESSGDSRGIMDAVAEFAAAFPVAQYRHTPIEIHGDASGYARRLNTPGSDYDTVVKYLRTLGYLNLTVRAPTQNPEIRQRLEKMAALMAYELLVVNYKCRRLIRSFSITALRDGVWDIEKPGGEDHSHWGDACGYAMYEITRNLDIANPNNRPLSGFSM